MGCIPYSKNSTSIQKIVEPENKIEDNQNREIQEEHNGNLIQISSSKLPQSTSYQNKDSNIIILKPMPKQSENNQKFDSQTSEKKIVRSSSSNKIDSENNKLSNVIKVKKKINSSMNLLNNLEVDSLDSQKALPSLNKHPVNNTIEVLPCFVETMYDIWIEKDKEIKIVISGNWGIKEKGNTNENGYEGGLVDGYNLCSLLYRIGTDRDYQKLTHKDEESMYVLKSDIEGPLFFKMNINKEVILNNRFNLFGQLNVDILNMTKLLHFDIFQKMGWKNTFLKEIFDNSMFQSLSEDESRLLFYLNLLRAKPVLFIDYFFKGNSDLKNELFNLNTIQDILHMSDKLKNVIGNKNDNNYETRKTNFFSQFPEIPIVEITVKTFTNSEIEMINAIIDSGNYQWIFENQFNAIGIVISSNQEEDPNINFTCDLLITTS